MNLMQRQSDDAASAQLGEIIDDYLERIARGERPDIDRCAQQHPELATVIRKMLPTLEVMQMSAEFDATLDAEPTQAIRPQGPLGDFLIVRELGRGGMGVVYEAQQISLGRTVALKVLPFAAAMDDRHLQRFKNEALAAAHLDHPNIVDVYGVGCERGVHFYAMRHIDGQSFATVIEELRCQDPSKRDGPAALEGGEPSTSASDSSPSQAMHSTGPIAALSTERTGNSIEFFRSAARLAQQAADALEHAHQMGVVHRDIKPGNLLLDHRGNLWVTDFGLAQIQSSTQLTMTGDLLGTLRYMSPEQALAKRITVDHRTDVYSLGATLYELLTLQSVFSGRDREQLLRQIAFDEPKPPRRLTPSIPVELETIVLKAIAKNPDERYGTAREMADDLQRFVDDRPIQARRPTLVQQAARFGRRHRSVVVTTGVFLVLAVIGLAISTTVISSLYRAAVEAREGLAGILGERDKTLVALQQKTGQLQERTDEAEQANEELAKANAREKENNYSFAVALALRSAMEGDFAHARTLLLECPEELRLWEWYFTLRLCSSDVVTYSYTFGDFPSGRPGRPGPRKQEGSTDLPVRGRPASAQERDGGVFPEVLFAPRSGWPSPPIEFYSAPFRPEAPILAIPEPGAVTILDAASGNVLYKKQRELTVQSQTHELNGVSAFSPDGSLLAVSLCESAVHIHDAESGDERFLLPGHVGPITDIAFSSDGKWLASSSVDGTIRVSDLTDRECKYTWDSGDNMILEIAFLGDGPDQMACLAQRRDESIAHRLDNPRRRIIGFKSSIVDGKVQVVNVAKGSPADEVGLRMGDFVMKLNGESISSMDEVIDRLRTVNLGDSVTLTIERDSQELELEMTPVPLGELFPAELLVPLRHRTNEYLYALNVVSGEVRFTRRVSPRPLCFGGDYIAITQPLESTNDTPLPLGSASGGLQLLNSRTGDVVAELEGTHLVFSSDGAKALVWGQHGLRIIDPKSGETLKVLSEGNLFRSAAFSPDQQLVAAKAPPGVFIFDVSSGQAIGQYSHFMQSGPASQASFSSDGKFLALGTQSSSNFKRGCNVSVWNLARLQMQRRGTVVADKLGKIGRFVLSPTGEHFAAAVGKDGTSDQLSEFVIGSIATGELRTFEVPEASRYGAKIVFSRDGKLVIYGNYCEDSTTGERESFAHVYSVTAPDKEVLKNTFHSEEGDVWALPHSQIQLAVTPERTMIFLGSRRRLLDFETGEPILDFELDTRSCLSPDGKFIATWRMRPPSSVYSDGKPFEWIRPFASGPPSGFSEDNHYLLTSTGSSPRHTVSVHILDSQSGKLVSTYAPRRAQFAGRQFSFNPSGTRLAIFERESTDLAIVDVRTGRELIYVHHDEPLAGVGFHPDGNRLYTATRDGKVIMWDGTPQPVEQQTSHPPQPGGVNTPSSGINPARFAEMFIARFDKDGDGKLSEEETVFWSRLAGADRDNDGKLDFDEIQSGLEEMRKNRRTEDSRE